MAVYNMNVGPAGVCNHELKMVAGKPFKGLCMWGHNLQPKRVVQVDSQVDPDVEPWLALGEARFNEPNGWSWDG
jgi:hypothetical protein